MATAAAKSEKAVGNGAQHVTSLVQHSGDTPFFIGRNGTIELEVLYFWLIHRAQQEDGVRRPYPERLYHQLQCNAGVFPPTDSSIDAWCKEYVQSLRSVDAIAAGWYAPLQVIEAGILSQYLSSTCKKVPLRSLEPYYVESTLQWTRGLVGKRVAVVSSFADTIRKQIWSGALDKVWRAENTGILPFSDIEWSFHRTGYAPATALGRAGWPSNITSWQQALDKLTQDVVGSGAEIALIGCGGLGMPLAARLRRHGISAFVLGGAIQVLFGIRGERWRRHEVIGKFWNEAWVWPSADEIPGGANMIEGYCYWKGDTV
jgi:hypothetical protein